MHELLDIVFKCVMGVDHSYATDNDKVVEAKALFVNDDGPPYGAVMYGLFLNL